MKPLIINLSTYTHLFTYTIFYHSNSLNLYLLCYYIFKIRLINIAEPLSLIDHILSSSHHCHAP